MSTQPTTDLQSELLDVVDQHDNVIAVETRGEVHRLMLRHRACHILVFNSQGQVFVQKRSMSKDNNPGLWDSSAAGHVDSGESYRDCAVRELHEELGLRISSANLNLVFILEACELTGMEFAAVYTVVSDAGMTLDTVEVADGLWIEQSDLLNWVAERPDEFTRVFADIWKRICSDSE